MTVSRKKPLTVTITVVVVESWTLVLKRSSALHLSLSFIYDERKTVIDFRLSIYKSKFL